MGDNRYLDTIVDTIKHLLKQPLATHIWTATWQPEQIQYMNERLQLAFNLDSLSSLEVNNIQHTILKINAVLIEYTKEIVSDRIHRLREIDKTIRDPIRKSQKRRDNGSILIKYRKIQSRVKIPKKLRIKLSKIQQNDLKLAKTIKKIENSQRQQLLVYGNAICPVKHIAKSKTQWDNIFINREAGTEETWQGYMLHQQYLRHLAYQEHINPPMTVPIYTEDPNIRTANRAKAAQRFLQKIRRNRTSNELKVTGTTTVPTSIELLHLKLVKNKIDLEKKKQEMELQRTYITVNNVNRTHTVDNPPPDMCMSVVRHVCFASPCSSATVPQFPVP